MYIGKNVFIKQLNSLLYNKGKAILFVPNILNYINGVLKVEDGRIVEDQKKESMAV